MIQADNSNDTTFPAPIAILGAMDCEIEGLTKHISIQKSYDLQSRTVTEGSLEDKDVIVMRSGVGKVLSAATTQYLITTYRPNLFIFTGIAGALNPNYEIGDVIVATDTVQHDMDATKLGFARGEIPFTELKNIPCDSKTTAILETYTLEDNHKLAFGRVLTGDQFISESHLDSHRYLTEELGGDAIEMEGASVATICHLNTVPCCIIRTISDRADHSSSVDFESFLPLATKHSVDIVRYLLKKL